jgi:hypothetical protein
VGSTFVIGRFPSGHEQVRTFVPSQRVGQRSAPFALGCVSDRQILGTLMGASLCKWLTERFSAWHLQIGRAGGASGARTDRHFDPRMQWGLPQLTGSAERH